MYSIDIIKSTIQLYYKLKKDNIIGKQRINYIKSTTIKLKFYFAYAQFVLLTIFDFNILYIFHNGCKFL